MSDSTPPPSRTLCAAVAGAMALVGIAVFAIRLHHAGPYAFPQGGNLRAGVLSLLIAAWLARPWLGAHKLARPLGWIAIAISPPVLFFALYATLAELEEVVTLEATDRSGNPAALRLWIVDRPDGAWVTMPRSKADEHGLASARVRLLREGQFHCVTTTLREDPAEAAAVHALRHEKYAVQRLATRVGLFGETAGPTTVALQLLPCAGDELPSPMPGNTR